MLVVVDDAELSGSHPVHGFVGVYDSAAVVEQLKCGRQILWRVADFKTDTQSALCLRRVAVGLGWQREPVEVVYGNVLHVGCLGVVAVADVEDVALHVLLHHKPRAAAQSESLALADGVELVAMVQANNLARFLLHHFARPFAQQAAEVAGIVNLSQEADALAVAPVCGG